MKNKKHLLGSLICILFFSFSINSKADVSVVVVRDPTLGKPALHGLHKLEQSLQAKGYYVTYAQDMASLSADFIILAGKTQTHGPATETLRTLNVSLPEGQEALVVQNTKLHGKPALVICGSDDVGLMYAALDVADRVNWIEKGQNPFLNIRNTCDKPFVKERAMSIYTMHRTNFENLLFDEHQLEQYFDMLASSRINSFVVVFGYENGGFMASAYPYFFNLNEFPDVYLEGLTPEQQKRNTEAFRKMIQMAHDRGIDFCPAFWDHIYRGKVQGGGIQGASEVAEEPRPHLVWGVTTENLVDYNKAALTKFLQVFPNIDAIQFRVHWESGLTREETPDFWHDMFGIIKENRHDLRIDLRAKGLPDQVIDDAIAQGLNFRITTKYWMEQMGLPFHPTHINKQNQNDRRHGYADLLRYPQRYPIHWRLWNGGTTRFLLWGDPDYVRKFAESTRIYDGNSFEINDMLATKMLGEEHDAKPVQILNPEYQYYDYEFQRYWHFYQTWGRVSYNPEVSGDIWKNEFKSRFGGEAGIALMRGLHLASRVLPRIVAASYPYSYFPTTRGWAEMMRQNDLPEYSSAEGSDIEQFMNMSDRASSIIDGSFTAKRRPEVTSQWFDDISRQIMDQVTEAESNYYGEAGKEFISTVTDLKILSSLAKYHSYRLLAGVQYNLYKQTGDLFSFDRAIELEELARDAWRGIVDAARDVYSKELIFGVYRVGFSRHWSEQLMELESGLDQLKADRQVVTSSLKTDGFKIAHVPVRRHMTGEEMKIQATVFSGEEINQAVVFAGQEGKYETVEMKFIEKGMYQASIPILKGEGSLDYFIEARDSKGNIVRFPEAGEKGPINVILSNDEIAPEIQLEHVPSIKPGNDLRVHTIVSDPSGIKWLRLRYRHLTQFEDYRTLEMEYDPVTGLYHADIPAEFIVPEWDIMYFVESVDLAGNGCMVPDLEKGMPYVIVKVEH